MKLVGRISVNLEVASFAEAGDHQRALESLLDVVRARYPEATFEFSQRRERTRLEIARYNEPVVRFDAKTERRR